jgi:hypothetical protein
MMSRHRQIEGQRRRQPEEQRKSKAPNLDKHYREIGIAAVRATVYVLTDSSAVLTDTSADHKDAAHSQNAGHRKRSR